MNIYLDNVLKGFIGKANYVELNDNMRNTPEFIVTDVDQDDMPEIMISFSNEQKDYIGALKKKEGKWQLETVNQDDSDANKGLKSMINTIQSDQISEENIGESFELSDLFKGMDIPFISMIDGEVYYGNIKVYDRMPTDMDPEVIQMQQANVLGNETMDTIYITGERVSGEVGDLYSNIRLVVKDGNTGETIEVSLPTRSGYQPVLTVEDFTGDGKKDILIMIYTGKVGQYVDGYIYTFEDDMPELIFNTNVFNQDYTGFVEYEDGYKVKVQTLNPPREYILDVSQKEDEYMTQIYDEQDNLIEDTYGEILGAAGLSGIDYDKNGIYALDVVQRVIGPSTADTLGLIETLLQWDSTNKVFVPQIQYMNLYGKPIDVSEIG